jgi:hypothetical protein
MIAFIITCAVCAGVGLSVGVVLGMLIALEHKRVGHR